MADSSPAGAPARQRLHGIAVEVLRGFPDWPPCTRDDSAWTVDLDLGPRVAAVAARDLDRVAWRWELEGRPARSIRITFHSVADGRRSELLARPPERSLTFRADGEEPDSRELLAFVLATRMLPLLARLERGSSVLHAVAVTTSAGALAVCGPSGAGKSTLAAALIAAGARLHGEEPVVVDDGSAWAGTAHLRLIDGSPGARCLEALGWSRLPSWDKPVWSPPALEHADAPVPLQGVLLLGRPADGRDATVRRLSATEALPALMRQRFAVHGYGPADDLSGFAALVGAVPVWEARVPVVEGDLAGLGRAILALVEEAR